MESIGTILQNERVNKGISLAEAHEATKITVHNLTALEEDRFESFPNRVYARAFLRDYANYLRLDSAELLERYESEWGPKSRMEPARKGSRLPVAAISLVVLLLAAIAAGAYYLSQQQKKPKTTVTAQRAGQTSSKPKPKPTPTPKPAKPEAPAAVPVVDPAQAEELKLQITGTSGSWVKVVPDNQAPVVFMLAAGEVKSFTAKDKFTVRLGRPHGVRLHMNGQILPPLGPPGTSVTKDLDRSSLKPAPANSGANASEVPGVSPAGTNPPEGMPKPPASAGVAPQ